MKMMVRYRLFQILSKQTLKQTLAIILLLSIHAVAGTDSGLRRRYGSCSEMLANEDA